MKKIFFMSLLALTFVAVGCGKDGEKTYDVPAKSETKIEGKNVIRTQVVQEGKKAVEITYFFDENVKYDHQEWKIIFSTVAGATTAGLAAQIYYASKPTIQVSYSANVVSIIYPLGEGTGDEELKKVTSLSEVESAVQIADILGVLSLF